MCFEFDGVTRTLPFNPITMDNCSDTGNLITYEVDVVGAGLDQNYFKISVDQTANEMRLTGLTGGSASGTYTLTVTGTLPDSAT